MATLIENAGAQHGCLVLQRESDQQFYVEARASVEAAQNTALIQSPGHSPRRVRQAVRYVLRTRDALALDDASSAGGISNRSHIRA